MIAQPSRRCRRLGREPYSGGVSQNGRYSLHNCISVARRVFLVFAVSITHLPIHRNINSSLASFLIYERKIIINNPADRIRPRQH